MSTAITSSRLWTGCPVLRDSLRTGGLRVARGFVAALSIGFLSSPSPAAEADSTISVWVFLTDHGESRGVLNRPSAPVSDRARARMATRGSRTEDVLAVYAPYVERVSSLVNRVRTVSRWLNAVSADATPAQIESLRALPEVRAVSPVRTYRHELPDIDATQARMAPGLADTVQQRYGASFWQYGRVGIPELHALGLTGSGVMICVIDAGFTRFDHPAFAHLKVVQTKDFITGSTSLTPDSHGAQVLSVIAGNEAGMLVGPAYGAEYTLARTEARAVEVRAEEDFWIAAVEWADSAGVDIITSSLGYNTFDDPSENHSLAELDGSSLITRAADRAVARGIVVVASAGNERGASGAPEWQGRITLPADGFGVLAVGSLTAADQIAASSSTGPTADGRIKPDLVAPGDNVLALDVAMTSGYARVSGTSFAAPIVAGAAALLLEKNPLWTPADVRRALLWSAEDILTPGPDVFSGWGVMNANLAVDEVVHSGIVGRVYSTVAYVGGQAKDVPVAGVRVELRNGSGVLVGETTTDVRGRFSFSGQPDGAYRVRLSHPGFDETQSDVTIPQTVQLRFTLLPASSAGAQAYRLFPNPATPASGVTISGAAHPDLIAKFYDISGTLVRTLGPQQMYWDLTSQGGRQVAGGVYFCRIEVAGSEVWNGKIAVVR
ncbi:MAG TPA: S8 family serine peptidase [Candidatus Latescibacteria bacterium]|nr:S8 family serine peptidase [Candidatus Latescibacterota bacterium]